MEFGRESAADLLSVSQGVLASGLSVDLNAMLAKIVTIAALARAFHVARREGRAGDAVDGLFRGAVTAATSLAVVSAVAALGGPAGLALLVGLIAGMLAAKAVSRVSVVEVGQVVAEQARASARLLLGPGLPRRGSASS